MGCDCGLARSPSLIVLHIQPLITSVTPSSTWQKSRQHLSVKYSALISVVVKDLRLKDKDKDKDLMSKDEDKDEDLSIKDKDKDKDLSRH